MVLVKVKKNCTVRTTKCSLLPTCIMIEQISSYLYLVIMHGCIMIVEIAQISTLLFLRRSAFFFCVKTTLRVILVVSRNWRNGSLFLDIF